MTAYMFLLVYDDNRKPLQAGRKNCNIIVLLHNTFQNSFLLITIIDNLKIH